MPITDEFLRVPCESIIIDRENRQRRNISTANLRDSIAKHGVLKPIIIRRDMTLVAGERRLTASMELKLPDIICRFLEDLAPEEAHIIELEENLKRSDLSWQDTASAIAKLHTTYLSRDPDWTHEKTGNAIGLERTSIHRYLRVADDLSNPNIAKQTSLETAYNILKRQDERRAGDAMAEIMAVSHTIAAEKIEDDRETDTEGEVTASTTVTPQPSAASVPILNVAFSDWVSTYTGPPFNFIHCDFPYGVNVFDGEYGDSTGTKHYEDTIDVYMSLLDVLASNVDKLVAYSSHLMFWFSMEHYETTMEFFRRRTPDIVWQKFPLIWTKSDNMGIMPDPKRGPRRIYETCLIGTRGDRPVVKPISNAYSCPTDKRYHPSTKPEPMLRHFMQMFVDNGTRMLDPTCGSASALRAATTLGAESVLGLEMDPGHHEVATKAYETFLKLRSV